MVFFLTTPLPPYQPHNISKINVRDIGVWVRVLYITVFMCVCAGMFDLCVSEWWGG